MRGAITLAEGCMKNQITLTVAFVALCTLILYVAFVTYGRKDPFLVAYDVGIITGILSAIFYCFSKMLSASFAFATVFVICIANPELRWVIALFIGICAIELARAKAELIQTENGYLLWHQLRANLIMITGIVAFMWSYQHC
jgi:hypothetical protein